MRCPLRYKGLVIVVFLIACNSVSNETNNSISDKKKDAVPYLFQDTSVKRYLFEGGYEGAILQTYREENKMFPFSTSHTRLKVSLTQDSTFVVNYLFFKNGSDTPDTVIYFLRWDHPENSYYLRREPNLEDEAVQTRVNLIYVGRQVIPSDKKNYEIFKFKSKDGAGTELHIWLPDIGIIKLESEVYNRSFVLSFGSDDFRTKIIKDILERISL